jgi:histidinol-phosphate aminotransferase
MSTLERAIDADSKLLFLCSPGNPTAKSIPLSTIEGVAKLFNGLVVVDEAYIDFRLLSPEPHVA